MASREFSDCDDPPRAAATDSAPPWALEQFLAIVATPQIVLHTETIVMGCFILEPPPAVHARMASLLHPLRSMIRHGS